MSRIPPSAPVLELESRLQNEVTREEIGLTMEEVQPGDGGPSERPKPLLPAEKLSLRPSCIEPCLPNKSSPLPSCVVYRDAKSSLRSSWSDACLVKNSSPRPPCIVCLGGKLSLRSSCTECLGGKLSLRSSCIVDLPGKLSPCVEYIVEKSCLWPSCIVYIVHNSIISTASPCTFCCFQPLGLGSFVAV
jgi:hypothetical protein